MLTDRQMEEFKEAFSLFDGEGKGTIASGDLGTALRSLELAPTEEELTEMVIDSSDSDGRVDFPTFLTLAAQVAATHPVRPEDEIHEAMKGICGIPEKISTAELRTTLAGMGEGLTDEEIEQMVRDADVDGSGLINFEEFFQRMKRDSPGPPSAAVVAAAAAQACDRWGSGRM